MPSVDYCMDDADDALWIQAADKAVSDAKLEFDGL